MTTTSPYPARQPRLPPSTAARGTPTMLATVRPSATRATAVPRRSRGTREEATTAATPK